MPAASPNKKSPCSWPNSKNLLVVVRGSVKLKQLYLRYKKPVIITASVILLQVIFGFDPKFCIINIIWLFV